MVFFRMEITDLKRVDMLLNRYYSIQTLCGPSNEILCIRLAQGAVKLQEVIVDGPKKR